MRPKYFQYAWLLFALFCLCSNANAQESLPLKDNECYVVVGAFNLEKNAENYSSSLTSKGIDTQHKYNSDRELHYVYTYHSQDREEAKSRLFSIREEHSDMSDAWLYAGNFKNAHITSAQWAAMLTKPESIEEESSVEKSNQTDIQTASEEVPLVESIEESSVDTEPLEEGTFRVYLNAVDAVSGKELQADFKVFDMTRSKSLSPVRSHQALEMRPGNGSNLIKLTSDIIGFKPQELTIDLDEPLVDTGSQVEMLGDTILIDFELAPYQKGDIVTLWKVYFYRDAAIMKEESVYELNQLLGMMKRDEKMKILIHGHTNGNSHGKVMHLDLDDKQFFSLNGSHHEDVASAKKLSLYRAYTIQHWLIDQGISEERMDIKGWGGKKALHDKHDSQAHQNVRVEIEVIESSKG